MVTCRIKAQLLTGWVIFPKVRLIKRATMIPVILATCISQQITMEFQTVTIQMHTPLIRNTVNIIKVCLYKINMSISRHIVVLDNTTALLPATPQARQGYKKVHNSIIDTRSPRQNLSQEVTSSTIMNGKSITMTMNWLTFTERYSSGVIFQNLQPEGSLRELTHHWKMNQN